MRYFGTKVTTREAVFNILHKKISHGTICDPFGGIGSIGSFFKSKGYVVWSGDILRFAYYFQIARIERNRTPSFKRLKKNLKIDSTSEIIDFLNNQKPQRGWFDKEYAERRHFFTSRNARLIDACVNEIKKWTDEELVTPSEKAVLLASLINSMDKVANTAGTYYAYLKTWNRKALRPFRFDLIPFTDGETNCRCFLIDAKELVKKRHFNILYLDPPYNNRSYENYYHLPETIANLDKPFVHGMSGVPNRPKNASEFNTSLYASRALKDLMDSASYDVAMFHYSDDGVISRKQVQKILTSFGRVKEYVIDAKGYSTKNNRRTINHRLYVIQ